MNIAFIANNSKKELITQFCIAYYGILREHNLIATASTGKKIKEATGLKIDCLLSGDQGGYEQIGSKISYKEIDLLIFFKDKFDTHDTHDVKEKAMEIFNLCDLHTLPYATNLATAELLIKEAQNGDFHYKAMFI